MSRPTHVIVGSPVDCKACGGTGESKAPGFEHFVRIDGTMYRPCPECRGATFRQYAMTLEEFAKLFTYGEAINFLALDEEPREREIRVREDDRRTDSARGE
jgi:hypothetical protein